MGSVNSTAQSTCCSVLYNRFLVIFPRNLLSFDRFALRFMNPGKSATTRHVTIEGFANFARFSEKAITDVNEYAIIARGGRDDWTASRRGLRRRKYLEKCFTTGRFRNPMLRPWAPAFALKCTSGTTIFLKNFGNEPTNGDEII